MPSRSREAPVGNLALLEAQDTHAALRNKLRIVSELRDEWAGIPMPLENERLVIEPSYPKAAELMAIAFGAEYERADEEGYQLRNKFYSHRRRCDVLVMEKDGRVVFGLDPAFHGLPHAVRTLGCADAWGIEQESAAVATLASLIRHRHFKQYMLTGMFMETSRRSGLTYLFRRLRPTVVLSAAGGYMRVLCALCLHPIGYYAGSWAGAMCPTDDVIAHLMLMRGDEPMFWRRANQHPAWRPESGL